jgi:predicted permease
MRTLFMRLAGLLNRRRSEARLDEEIRVHLDQLAADYERRGMSPQDARDAARRAFGGVEPMKERYRDRRTLRWLEDLARDLQYAMRSMRRYPGFAGVALLTLALGIGANTALFSVINAVMLRPLPVPRPDELRLFAVYSSAPLPMFAFSYSVFQDMQRDATAFAGVALHGGTSQMRLRVGSIRGAPASSATESVRAQPVSGNFFLVLGVPPAAGRTFRPDDDRLEAATAVVLSEAFWSRRFGRDPDVIGQQIALNDEAFTIVGVAAAGFTGVEVGAQPDVWWPSEAFPRLYRVPAEIFHSRSIRSWRLVGRLAPGADPAQAAVQARAVFDIDRRAQLQRTAAQLGGTVPPEDRARLLGMQMRLEPGYAGFTLLRWRFRQPLLILMGLVGVVLLIACANVTNLLLARATTRRQEFAVRMALGSGRGRLIRQMLTESALLAAGGAIAGGAIALVGTRLVTAFLNTTEVVISAALDQRVLLFTAAVSILAAIVAGLAPALAAARLDLAPRDARAGASRDRLRAHHAIVAAQVALSIVVLVVAGLFIRTRGNLQRVDLGFASDDLTVVSLETPSAFTAERRLAFYREVLDGLASVPGQQAAMSIFGVMSGGGWSERVEVEGRPSDPDRAVNGLVVNSTFFDVTGTRIVAGRGFSMEHDRASEPVAVVSQAMARQFFGGAAVGRRFRLPGPFPDDTFTVIGVAQDSTYRNLRDEAAAALPIVYFPALQGPGAAIGLTMSGAQIHVRSGSNGALAAGVRDAVRRADPAVVVRDVQSMRTIIADTLSRETLLARLGLAFGAVALVLGAVGIYGVRSYAVSRRLPEFGVRLALGAAPGRIGQVVLRESLSVTSIGIGIGLMGAAAVTRLLTGLLFGVAPLDLTTFVTAAIVFGAVALAASSLPARRAMRLDPVAALRSE